ncbi:hypothetical protein D3C81_1995680 [compost metagenome]
MSRVLRPRPFRADKGSFQMYTCKLRVRHFAIHVLMDFCKHMLNNFFGHRHCSGKHGGRALRAMQLRDGIKALLARLGEILKHSAVNMNIDEAGKYIASLGIYSFPDFNSSLS